MYEFEAFKEDIYTCNRTHCGFCTYACPSFTIYWLESYGMRGRILILRRILEGGLTIDKETAKRLHSCTMCGYCDFKCSLNPSKILEVARRELFKMGLIPKKHKQFGKYVEEYRNPYGERHDERFSWVPSETRSPRKATSMYFAGCTTCYRQRSIGVNTIRLLRAIGTNFTLLGKNEFCCGSPLLRTGQVEIAKKLINHNLKVIKKMGVLRVISSCAGCYRTLKFDYPELAGVTLDFDVVHMVQVLAEAVEKEKIKLKSSHKMRATYHDPCHLGRHSNVYEEPRKILENIVGLKFIEMEQSKENAFCCGSGGGVKSAFPELALKIAQIRVKQAEEIGCELLITACPFCVLNLSDAVKTLGSHLKVLDITELVANCLPHVPPFRP